jgi:PKD repeat protein
MRREISDLIIGLILLMVGIIVMLSVFFMAMNLAFSAGDFFREQFPQEEKVEGPEAAFSWSSNSLQFQFQDDSQEGDGNIIEREWFFGEGDPDYDDNPQFTYSGNGTYQVTLRVEDENGKRSSIRAEVDVEDGADLNGASQSDFPEIGFDVDFSNIIFPIAAALLIGTLFLVMFLVGAAITKAGWNILKPKPEKLKIKLKPKEMEIKQVGTYAAAPQEPVYQQPQQPVEQYSPPPPQEYEGQP